MTESKYVVGRNMDPEGSPKMSGASEEAPVGTAHAVLIEAAKGDGPYPAECGEQVRAIRGGAWPPSGPGAAAPCPICSRVTGA